MKSFKSFIVEGGNLEIDGAKAGPIHVTPENRGVKAREVHGALMHIHHSMNKHHGIHLFGKGAKALKNKSAYSGSSKHLVNKRINNASFAKHKPKVGDVDVQIPHEHAEHLHKHLTPGRKFGKYTVVGSKKHGAEISTVMRHDNGEHHQFDFEKTHYKNHAPEPHEGFLHSSSWKDTKSGIKGAHHKILINAVGRDHHKFSITHGVRSRTDANDPGHKDPKGVTKRLFGPNANHKHITSFKGVASLIKKHTPVAHHREIFDKFKSSVKHNKNDHSHAIKHLKKTLNIHEAFVTEEKTHHTSVIPLMGVSPISHMGHAHDMGSALKKLPGTKHIGLSGKADVFTPNERKTIMRKQMASRDIKHHVVKGVGHTLAKAHASLPKTGRRELHLLVGHDRKDFAHHLKKSIEAGKIKEIPHGAFHKVHIHHPDDTGRSHGMSGTKMRQAVHDNDKTTFHKHLGPMFNTSEKETIFHRIRAGIAAGKVKVKR